MWEKYWSINIGPRDNTTKNFASGTRERKYLRLFILCWRCNQNVGFSIILERNELILL